MNKVTNKDISKYLNKSVSTINGWSSRNPKLLELVKLGAFCKKNNITIDMLKNCVEMTQIMKKEVEKNKHQ